LTIKSISNTKYSMSFFLRAASPPMETCVVRPPCHTDRCVILRYHHWEACKYL